MTFARILPVLEAIAVKYICMTIVYYINKRVIMTTMCIPLTANKKVN